MTDETDGLHRDEIGNLNPEKLLEAGLAEPDGDGLDPERLARAFPGLEIFERLGRGGMGVVYRARQTALDRDVALKILPPELGDDPAFAGRFAREAKALARLDHPNIVHVHEAGERDGLYFLVMEYVDGVNLREAMHDQPLEPAEALRIVPQICDALQFAHDAGIVHRDVKPENLLIARGGRVKIADFGLAKIVGGRPADVSLTGVGQVMGTYHYIAPEQMETPRDVDHRADVYSLGVVFYEMLTGELPIGQYPPPSEKVRVDVRLDAVVLRTLERKRERRYQHVSEVKTGVESVVAAPGTAPALAPRVADEAPRLSRLAIAGALGIPAALVAWALVVAMGARDEHAMLAAAAIALGGMVLSLIARSVIRADPRRRCGAKLARAGVLIPPVLGVLVFAVVLGIYLVREGRVGAGQRQVESEIRRVERESRLEAELEHHLLRLASLGPAETVADVTRLVAPSARPDLSRIALEGDAREGLSQLLGIDIELLRAGVGTFRIAGIEMMGDRAVVTISGPRGSLRIRMIEEEGAWFLDPGEHVRLDR